MSAAVNLLVARRLGPEKLGIVGLVQLWLLYSGFARPGILQAAYREMLHLMGQNKPTQAQRLENIALTGEGVALLLPLAAMIAAGLFWYSDRHLQIALIIAALTFVGTSLYQFIDTIQWVYQRFALITRVSLLQQIAGPILMLLGLYVMGLYGVLLAPAIAAFVAVAYFKLRTAALKYQPAWDTKELGRLFRIGFPLSLYGFLYWGFRTSDRAMVASWLTIKDLGYFTFAMMFITQGCQLVSDFLNVLQTSLFTELGRVGKVRPLADRLQRISVLILLCTGAAANAAQAGFFPAVGLVAPKFLPSVPAFEVLALNLVCTSAPLLAYSVLLSAAVDEQNTCTMIQAVGLAFNIALGWLFIRQGWGLSGIAWSSALSQLLVAGAAYALLHRRLFERASPGEYLRFYVWIGSLVAAAVGLHFVMQRGIFSYSDAALWLPLFSRSLLCIGAWSFAAWLCYRRWWSAGSAAA